MDEYVPVPYPAWRYHSTLEARIVADEAADKALGSDWSSTPVAKGEEEVAAPSKEAETTEELAEELGAKAGFTVKPKKGK